MKTIGSAFPRLKWLILFVWIFGTSPAWSQVEGLFVETYYIADANDATDTTLGRSLQVGMKTYRVYLDLAPGSKLKKVFGSDIHPLRISSTMDFYNNIDRPNAHFGYLINKSWLDDNPTLALDSWLTLGLGTTTSLGSPKPHDTDGAFSEITMNNGGTAGVSGGLLMNQDPAIGLPLSVADGYIPNSNSLGQWIDNGFKDGSGDDTTIFGSLNTGTEFVSHSAYLQQTNGVSGSDSNMVLIAQLTTLGTIAFEINVEIEEFDGTGYSTVTYVASGDSLLPGQAVSPYLTYPPACGCTDPDYLEFSSAYACHISDSCKTLVILGCMDSLACNFDPDANVNVLQLCCYPGYCNDRDLSVVCPGISADRFAIKSVSPNPVRDRLSMELHFDHQRDMNYFISDTMGKRMLSGSISESVGVKRVSVDVTGLAKGLYHFIIFGDEVHDSRSFVVLE